MTDQNLEFTGDYGPVQRNFDRLGPAVWAPVPQARVFNSANISITNNSAITLTFNSERYDEGELHSTASNTGRLTAPVAGLYDIGANVRFAAHATGFRQARFTVNGSTIIAISTCNTVATAGVPTDVPLSTEYQLVAGDYVEVIVFQTSGGALNVESAANFSPEFWMSRRAGFTAQVFE